MKKNVILLLITVFTLNLYSVLIDVPDWDNDIYSIQDGIELAVDGDTVLVTLGTYYENINFLGKKITVSSEFIFSGEDEDIENTIIDGGGDNSVVRMESGEDTLSYLCGFVIQNGNNPGGGGIHIYQSGAKLEHLKIRDSIAESNLAPRGGGIYGSGDCYNTPHPPWPDIIIRNVQISNNTVSGLNAGGGGIFFCLGFNLVILDNVTIINNNCEGDTAANAGGLRIHRTRNVLITNCEFSNNSVSASNSASGGGLSFLYIDEMLIDNCQITGNSVESDWSVIGGLGITTEGNVTIRNTIISDNSVLGFSSSGAGAATLACGDFLVENCEIRGNSAYFYNGEIGVGGGLCFGQSCNIIINKSLFYDNTGDGAASYSADSSDCLLINSVISNNHSNVNGGFRLVNGNRLRVINTIFWDNENSEIRMDDPLYLDIYHSIIEDGEDGIECYGGGDYYWGEGNLDLDPMFMDAANGNFHLLEGSPGIDSGMIAYLDWDYETHLIPEEEIIGRNRDIGVFETGVEDYIFDLPAYLVTDEDISIILALEEYMEGLSGEITISCENHLESVITDNIINWQPEENWFGFDEVWIELETFSGETYNDYVFIDVTGINDAPQITLPDSYSFNNIGYYSFNVMQYIFDAEGQLLYLSAAGSEHITAWVQIPYLFLEAEPGWEGTETVTVYAEDEWQRLLSSDTMLVEVYCQPIADCGDDIFARDGEQILLDGSSSIDPLLNGLSYFWSTEAGLQIDNADSVLALAQLPEAEEIAEAVIYLEVSDSFNSSTDSMLLEYWDDEPLDVECGNFPASNMIRISWDEPTAAGCEHIDLSGYQMYFEGCEYDTLQNAETCVYTFYLPEGEYEFGVQAVYSDGESDIVEVSSTDAGETELIEVTGLRKIYPNPFNPEVTVVFFTTEDTESTELNIYNVKGQRVKTLVNGILTAGEHTVIWHGKDDRGKQVSSGVYFVRVKIREVYVAQRKITVVK